MVGESFRLRTTGRRVGDLPTCAVCKKSVDHLSSEMNMSRGATLYTAKCHGKEETVVLTDAQMLAFDRLLLRWAFINEATSKKCLPPELEKFLEKPPEQ